MHRPGSVCATCHPTFTLSGTVYTTPNEPTGCYGTGVDAVDGVYKLSIQIAQANKTYTTAKINSAGNFWTTYPIAFPIEIGVAGANGDRYMQAKAVDGNCNTCHAAGTRILPPS